ncbi:hypothetical protein ABVT39_027319 [Epinephelus coioides]
MEQIKALLMSHPTSLLVGWHLIAASSSQFWDSQGNLPPLTAAGSSHFSVQSSWRGSDDSSMGAIIREALACLQLDASSQGQAPSTFHRCNPSSSKVTVLHSPDFLKELHSCWRDTSSLTRPGSDERALAAMEDAKSVGLLHMPVVEPPIAALFVAPDEMMKSNPKCPSAQCKVTDDYVCKAYNTAARVSRLVNTLSHLLLALSTSLRDAQVDDSVRDICDASLQAFAY